jgi:hypothetical protein
MGVRLRESMSRSKQRTTIIGLEELTKQIGRIGAFPKEMSRELRAANRKIGESASKKLKNQLDSRRLSRNFVFVDKGRKLEVEPGTLYRSIGVRNSRGSRINVFVGPRFGGAKRNDGFFAAIVESGQVGGRGRSIGSRNYNIIRPFLSRYSRVMERMQVHAYRRLFDKFKL